MVGRPGPCALCPMAALAEASRQLKNAAAEALAASSFGDLERIAAALRCLEGDPTTPLAQAQNQHKTRGAANRAGTEEVPAAGGAEGGSRPAGLRDVKVELAAGPPPPANGQREPNQWLHCLVAQQHDDREEHAGEEQQDEAEQEESGEETRV